MYFLRTVAQIEFRGRPLQGREVKIPGSYEGVVVTELKHNSKGLHDMQAREKSLRLTSQFDSFTYWNWDKPPSGMDSSVKLLDWLSISEIVSVLGWLYYVHTYIQFGILVLCRLRVGALAYYPLN